MCFTNLAPYPKTSETSDSVRVATQPVSCSKRTLAFTMSALNSNSSTRLLPTPFQLALALVIGRSKPSGVTIKGLLAYTSFMFHVLVVTFCFMPLMMKTSFSRFVSTFGQFLETTRPAQTAYISSWTSPNTGRVAVRPRKQRKKD